jgi:ribosomal protein L32
MCEKIEFVECDNCGNSMYVMREDVKGNYEYIHSVCPQCFLPIEVKNPFYKEADDGNDN